MPPGRARLTDASPWFALAHRGALGDFALTWPALFRLRELHPRHRFVGIGKPGHLELARALGLLDDGLDAEAAALLPLWRGERLPPALEGLARAGGRALFWMAPDEDLAGLLRARGISARFHPPFPADTQPPTHVVSHHLEAVGHAPLKLPRFRLPGVARLANRVYVHPGSGSPRKNLSREFYLKVADDLPRLLPAIDETYDVRFLIGPAEEEQAEFFGARFPVESPASPLELARSVGGATLFVGNDSGPAHVAALLGTPTLAFYRVADPYVWGVRGPHAAWAWAETETQARGALESAFEAFPFETGGLLFNAH